ANRAEPTCRGCPPQDRLDARDHLCRGGGLDDVVVAAENKPADLVCVAVARAQEEHRHVRITTKAAADLEPRLVGQHHVQEHQVGTALRELLARLAAAGGVAHPEALGLQEVAHQLRDLLVVLDDQDRRRCLVSAAHTTSVAQAVATESPPTALSSTFHRRLPGLLSARAIIEACLRVRCSSFPHWLCCRYSHPHAAARRARASLR